MKRFLTTSFIILALVVSAAGTYVPAAHADDIECTLNNGGTSCAVDGVIGICSGDENSGPYCRVTGTSDSTSFSDPAAAGTPKTYDAPPTTPEAGLNGIMAWIASLFAWLAGVAMVTLNYAVYFTVVTMGNYVNNLSAVGVTWQIMRDIGNIVIIFGFLAIGISTILNTERLGYGKKMLPMLLVAAVFLNFSLFLTEAVIDTGNLFATQFYTQINGGKLPTSDTIGSQGVSDKIMNQLGLTTIYGQVKDSKNSALYAANPMFIGFMSIILFLILAFVLFSLAFILIARFVILLFLIIIAPIGFAGLAVPQLKGTADKWWKALFEQTITAPVLLLLLYIALAIITDANFLTSGGKPPEWLGLFGKDGATNIAGFATAILSFLVAMGLLLAVVIIAKKMSAAGAAGATKLAGALSFGATAWAGRTTGGWIAKKTASGLRKTWVGRVPLAGTGLVKGLDKIASGSFDMRGVAMGGGLKALGIDAGTAQKGGYKADLKARTESRTKYASELTGRELNDDQKLQLAIHQKVLAADEKQLSEKRARQMRNKRDGVVDADLDKDIRKLEENTKKGKEEVEKIENLTDKGAQRKYARALNLWTDEKNFFNKYINFAANTDAAKIIRATAKKVKPDKDWTANMKNMLKEAAKESGEEEAGATPPPAAASTTPPPAAPTGGGTPPPAP